MSWKLCGSLLIAVVPVIQAASATISPHDRLVSIPGGSAEFGCLVRPFAEVEGIQWLANDTLLNSSSTIIENYVGSGFGTLTINNLTSEFNMTIIKCRGVISDNSLSFTSSTLCLLQGLLDRVGNLLLTYNDSFVTLTWTPPFSLNITDTTPDVKYCVDITNSFSHVLCSECNILHTQYTYYVNDLPQLGCDIIRFTVTPVNILNNGSNRTIEYFGSEYSPELVDVTSSFLTYSLIMSAVVCNSELQFVDIGTGENIVLKEPDLTVMNTSIMFTRHQLTANRLFYVAVMASNSHGQAVSNTTLSTHDIQGISFKSSSSLGIATDYLQYSNARGAFFVFLPLEGSKASWTSAVCFNVGRNMSRNFTLEFSLTAKRTAVLVYDIESHGLLTNGVNYPAVAKKLIRTNTNEGSVFTVSYFSFDTCHTTVSKLAIVAYCANSKGSVTGFQMIVQLSNSDQFHKLYVNSTRNSLFQTTVTVEKSGMYQVTIFAIRGQEGIVNSNAEYSAELRIEDELTTVPMTTTTAHGLIVGIIILLLFLTLMVSLMLLGASYARSRQRHREKYTIDIRYKKDANGYTHHRGSYRRSRITSNPDDDIFASHNKDTESVVTFEPTDLCPSKPRLFLNKEIDDGKSTSENAASDSTHHTSLMDHANISKENDSAEAISADNLSVQENSGTALQCRDAMITVNGDNAEVRVKLQQPSTNNYCDVHLRKECCPGIHKVHVDDVGYSDVGGMQSKGVTYAFVQPSNTSQVDTYEVSKEINDVVYSDIQGVQGQDEKVSFSIQEEGRRSPKIATLRGGES